MPRFLRSLFGQVVLALVVGVILGFVWPESAVKLKPLGDGFIKLIKMIIPVLVFCVVVHGIAGAGDLKRVGPGRRQVADLLRGRHDDRARRSACCSRSSSSPASA